VAAVVLSKDPSLTPDQVRAILQQSADDKGSPNRDPVFGFGRVNARRAVEH
jgi:subtilisin family serine protease